MPIHSVAVILVHLALAGIGVWLVIIDARTHRLPNRIVLPTLAALVLLVLVESPPGAARAVLAGAATLGLGAVLGRRQH